MRLMAAVGIGAIMLTAGAQEPKNRERFDREVRADLFKGFRGDKEALARGIKGCEEALKKDPKNAEALVWHGSATSSLSGQAAQKGDFKKAMELWNTAVSEMDEAVKLEPKNIGVRVPRAATMGQLVRFSRSAEEKKKFIATMLEDFTFLHEQHKADFGKLGEHRQGELLMGYADALRRAEKPEEAKAVLERVTKELPETKYAERAKTWLADPKKTGHNCIGCHTE
ncbi:MAG: tetratricopeptide repeat protein [Gemmataceae bacterium]